MLSKDPCETTYHRKSLGSCKPRAQSVSAPLDIAEHSTNPAYRQTTPPMGVTAAKAPRLRETWRGMAVGFIDCHCHVTADEFLQVTMAILYLYKVS